MDFPLSPLVSVIILNYNGGDLLTDCINSVLDSHYQRIQIIVVDNGSVDNSFHSARDKFTKEEKVEFIEVGKNTGFCIGNFIGLQRTKGDYIVLLNNDVIVDPLWLDDLVEKGEKDNHAFYQPKILLLDKPTTVDTLGNAINLSGICYSNGFGELDNGKLDRPIEIAYASGACVFTSRKVIDEIGFLDLSYFAFGEDADWGWRGKMFGIKSYYLPTSKVYHKWGKTWGRFSKNKMYLVERNRLITLFKNYSRSTLLLLLPLLGVVEISILWYAFSNGWLKNKIFIYSDIFKYREYIKAQRKVLQITRTVNDKEVVTVFSEEVHLYNSSNIHIFNKAVTPLTKTLRKFIR